MVIKKNVQIFDSLLGRQKTTSFTRIILRTQCSSMINTFFLNKISLIHLDFPLLEPTLKLYSFDSIHSILPHCTTIYYHFVPLISVELLKMISVMNKTTYFQIRFLLNYLYLMFSLLL